MEIAVKILCFVWHSDLPHHKYILLYFYKYSYSIWEKSLCVIFNTYKHSAFFVSHQVVDRNWCLDAVQFFQCLHLWCVSPNVRYVSFLTVRVSSDLTELMITSSTYFEKKNNLIKFFNKIFSAHCTELCSLKVQFRRDIM